MSDPSTPSTTVADDHILARRSIPAIKALREHLGCSLQDAVTAYEDRYEALRLEHPDVLPKLLDDPDQDS